MRTFLAKSGCVAAAALLTVGLVPVRSVQAATIHDDTKLAGFSVEVQASPIMVLLDDPNAAIPRPTGTAVLEADPNFTLASVAAGPNAHALASTLWPGNLLGEGLPAIDPRVPPYPLKAESRYPDKPYTAQGADGGTLTKSSALGLDAFAQADGLPTNAAGSPVTVGSVTSSSGATVTDKDVAVGTAVSAVKDVNVMGLIHIGAVTTHLTASSDGTVPAATGSTTVAGLTIAGQSFSVDDKGLHAGPQNSGLPTLTTPSDLDKTLGISVSAITQSVSKAGNRGTATSSGLVIRIDTKIYKAALKPAIDPLRPTYADLVSQLIPANCGCQGYFYYLLNATPTLTFVFGSGSTTSAATLPISFQFPDAPSFPGGPGGLGGDGGGAVGGVTTPPGLGGTPQAGGPISVPPVLQAPGGTNLASATASTHGLGAALIVGAVLGSALIGWGLLRFLGLSGGLLGFGCRLGAPTTVPDLRSVTA